MSVKAPYHWLKGAYPRGDTPKVVAHILAQRLNEPIEVHQIWPVTNRAARRADFARPSPGAGEPRRLRAVDGFGDSPGLSPWPRSVDARARMAAVLDWLGDEGGHAAASLSGEPLSARVLDAVEMRAAQVRTLHEDHGGTAPDLAVNDLTSVWGLIHDRSYTLDQARRLHLVMAELCEIAGGEAGGYGRRDECHWYLLTGLWAAHVAGDRESGARLIAGVAENLADDGREALRLIKVALKGIPGGCAAIRDLLHRRASTLDRLGDLAESAQRKTG